MSKFTRKLTSSVAPVVNTPGVWTVNERTQNSTALVISSIVVCDSGYNELDDTAVGTSGGYLKIKGTGFLSTATVYLNGVLITPTVTSSLELRITVPTLTVGTYSLIVFNTAAVGAIWAPGLVISGFPVWSTTTIATANLAVNTQLVASGDATLVYTLASGSLPPGIALSSGGLLSGTISPVPTVNTVYNFTVDVKDAQNQNLAQAITFSLTVDYLLAKSLRFRSSASAYLNRTAGTPTNNIKWTWSAWVKRGKLSSAGVLFQGYSSLSNRTALQFNSSDQLVFNGSVATATTTAVFRDPAAWYHIVCVYDSANGTAANRLLLYVNGTVQTVTGTQPTASQVEYINGAWLHYISTGYSGAFEYLDEDLAEVNFVDGQALAPTAFGAYSTYNQWLPIRYAGTYGTNGFYLPFNSVSTSSYAGSFNGSTQYISAAANAAFTVPSSTSFTIEAWIYITNLSYANGNVICANSSTSSGYAFLYNPTIGLRLYAGGGTVDINQGSVTGWVANTWYHVAAVRNGASAITLYRNGVSVATGTSTSSFGTGAYFVGASPNSPDLAYMNGYISNFRLVNGTAVYTAAFIPPTAALTAITNTSLLTLQNATIVDNSTNAFTITNTGTVVTSVQSPFLNPTVLTADSSGNANNWTPNNISLTAGSTYDSLTDVPTLTSTTVANYAVMNPIALNGGATLSSANLLATLGSTSADFVSSTIGCSGKNYIEFKGNSFGSGYLSFCVSNIAQTQGVFYRSDGTPIVNGSSTTGIASFTTSDIIAITVDTSTRAINLYKNNVQVGITYTASGTDSLFALISGSGLGSGSTSAYVNFGQQPFTYTPPSGFLPLNTYNI